MANIIKGPMHAGKSNELMRLTMREKYAKRTVRLFTYAADTRYTDNKEIANAIVSHDKHKADAKGCYSLEEIESEAMKYDVVGFDEFQFYKGKPIEVVKRLLKAGKIVYIAGLSGTWDLKPWENMYLIESYAKLPITTLNAVCEECGKDASFTADLNNIGKDKVDKIRISNDGYLSVCYECHGKYHPEVH